MHRPRALVTAALVLLLLQLSPGQLPAESLRPLRAMIQTSGGKLRAAAQRAGGLLEVYKNSRVQLLLDGSGHLLYRKANDSATRPARVRWWGRFQRRNLPGVSVEALGRRLGTLLAPRLEKQENKETGPRALLPDGTESKPDHYYGGFHGTHRVEPKVALKQGLPKRGNDWRLREHAEQLSCSAFRGCTLVPSDPLSGNGAAYWAGPGGWVYEIRGVPSWNVNRQLEGRVKTITSHYRGNLMHGENEIAIPAQVSPARIKAYGQVVEDSHGRLFVRDWIQNPGFRQD